MLPTQALTCHSLRERAPGVGAERKRGWVGGRVGGRVNEREEARDQLANDGSAPGIS